MIFNENSISPFYDRWLHKLSASGEDPYFIVVTHWDKIEPHLLVYVISEMVLYQESRSEHHFPRFLLSEAKMQGNNSFFCWKIQCVWLILSRKFSSSPAGGKLRVWRQASRAGGGVFTEVNWLKLRYILHIMICSINLLDGIHCRKCFFTQRFRRSIYSRLQVRVLSLERQFF